MLSMPAFLLLMCLLVLGAAGAGAATKEPAIYEIRTDGTGHRLVGARGAIGFALSADGSRLAFIRPGPTGTKRRRMCRAGLRHGGNVRTSLVVERTEAVLHRGAVNSGRR
jgi:hypothetical protein